MTSTAVEVHGPGIDRAPARLEDMKSFLARVSSPAGFEEQKQLATAYDRACESLIGAGDVQIDGDRTFKKKSAWRKLARHFSLSTVVVSSKLDYVANAEDAEDYLILVATVVVRAFAIWGQSSEAIGVCATDEESGQRVITIADALATAETRATNRAISNLIAMGEVSAEEISKGDGSPRGANGPPQRKERPAEEIKMPFGPSKGKLLGELETADLAGALRWAEDKSEEKGQPQFADFQKAAKQVLENRKKPAAPAAPDPAAAPAAPAADPLAMDLETAINYPFPFQRGKPNYGRPMGQFSNDHLIEISSWIMDTAKEQGDPTFHQRTRKAIQLILEHREKDQTKLELGSTEEVKTVNKGTPFEAVEVAAKTATAPSQSSQEAKTPPAATGGGPQRPPAMKPGKVSDAIGEPDPTSKTAMYARIKKALQSPAISPEARANYNTDNINGFKESKGARSMEWWVEALERTARMDPDEFPSALEDTAQPGKDGLPF